MRPLERKFNFSFDTLMFKVGDVVSSMTRDETEFTDRGITTVDRDNFETQGNDFEDFPNDDYYQGQIKIETIAKDDARLSTMAKVKKLASQVSQIFGDKSGQYRMLGMKNIGKKTDEAFITASRGVARVGEDYLVELGNAGVTQTQIDNLNADAQLLEDKLHAMRSKIALRDEKTNERTKLANELYEKLAYYCAIGKSIWEGIDEAKYNDYIIYPSVSSSLPKVQNLTAIPQVSNPMNADLSWDPVIEAVEYELYQSQVVAGYPAGEFSLSQTVPTPNYTILMEAGFTYYWKVRAKNGDMQGAFSDEATLTA